MYHQDLFLPEIVEIVFINSYTVPDGLTVDEDPLRVEQGIRFDAEVNPIGSASVSVGRWLVPAFEGRHSFFLAAGRLLRVIVEYPEQ